MGELLVADGWANKTAKQLAAWDPYDQNASSGFFDSEWMFGINDGFDVIIGNPPYIPIESMTENDKSSYQATYSQLRRKYDTSVIFILFGINNLNPKGVVSYISSVTWQTGENFAEIRKHIIQTGGIRLLINLPFDIFESAYVDTGIYLLSGEPSPYYLIHRFPKKPDMFSMDNLLFDKIETTQIEPPDFKIILDPNVARILSVIRKKLLHKTLGAISISTQGLSGSRFSRTSITANQCIFPFVDNGQVYRYVLNVLSTYNTDLSDKSSLIPFYEAGPKILIRRVINRQDRLMFIGLSRIR